MAGVTTVALLERKPGLSRSLFTRYWRDVHGVMAARIPGFESYTQHHVTPLADLGSSMVEPFEGIAVVTFADEVHRAGLVHSEVTGHIHRDEQNVFRRALLYNLAPGASVVTGNRENGAQGCFVVVPEGADVPQVAADMAAAMPLGMTIHDLTGGDPAGWNDTDVDDGGAGRGFISLIHAFWPDAETTRAAIATIVAAAGGSIAAYWVDETHVMVDRGRPTPVGLRGLDAVRAIEEAGAVNQMADDVLRAIYGPVAG